MPLFRVFARFSKFRQVSSRRRAASPYISKLAGRCGAAVLAISALAPAPVLAALTSVDLEALRWREIGSAASSGRITRFAVHPEQVQVFYVATASGGLWKTGNGGTTWRSVFEHQGSVSLGDVALAPSDPDIVWLGTGEQNSVRSSQFGDGVYRSLDGGDTWEHMGLAESRHIGRILIHPRNPDIVYVAAMGSLWGPNPERGLYRSRDGGRTWTRVLAASDYTGVVEVQMHPENPDLLYAATFQRERRMWSMVGGGDEGGLYRSRDGGDTWERVGGGFPTSAVGRVGVTFCPGAPDTMYATAVGPDGGTFRSVDAGQTWERRNAEVQSHWYYGEVFCDPVNPERVYVPVTPLLRSDDGGETFSNAAETMVHGDHHTLWINPDDPDHLMVGNDGGVYVSRDGGEAWRWASNLPVMQLYTVAVDMQTPFYRVYGGTQDNGTWSGPVGTRFSDGISNEDWRFVSGGDGFYAIADPTDPGTVYSQSQYGVLLRTHLDSGEQRRIQPWQPQEGEFPPYRWNWSAPFQISPHASNTLYFGANVVFRSDDRGTTWERISPDLTRQISRDELPLQGEVQPPDAIDLHASTAMYGNLHALRESPLRRGLLAAGSDDGLIHVSRDGGKRWQRSDSFPGVPPQMKVAMLAWSETATGTLFAVFDGHKDNLFAPYVVRSDDYGETWRNITGNLPAFGPTRSIAVHPKNPDLVFVGTDFGVFASVQGGEEWLALQSGLPTNSVQGMIVHPRDDDLVIGTHGRGFWVLDDLGLLAALSPARVDDHSFLAPPRDAIQLRDIERGRRAFGHSYWTAPNPPRGAIINYWIGDAAEGEAVSVDILDGGGEVVRRVAEHPAQRGAQRAVWDLRLEAPPSDSASAWRTPKGRFVVPGSYRVRLRVGSAEHSADLAVAPDPAVEVSMRDRRRREATLATQAQLLTAAHHAGVAMEAALVQTSTLLESLRESPAGADLLPAAEASVERVRALRIALKGEALGLAQQETTLPLADLALRLYMTTESWSGPPTPDQQRLTDLAGRNLAVVLEDLQSFLATDLPKLSDAVRGAGLVWPDEDLPQPLGAALIPER